MTTISASDLPAILAAHGRWLQSDPTGARAVLTDADLRDATLRGADLTDANLTRADLRDADLRDATLRGADLTDANLTRAVLTDANLTRAVLTDADLRDATLTGAVLTYADLRDATLRGAVLTDANLTGAVLMGADLTGATLRGAVLTDAGLTGAVLSDGTILDSGESWLVYRTETLPQLLHASERGLAAIDAWDGHTWHDCPMHALFDITSEDQAPALLRPRVRQFVQLFDAGMLPRPDPGALGFVVNLDEENSNV